MIESHKNKDIGGTAKTKTCYNL